MDVLLIEDELDISKSICNKMSVLGFNVTHCINGMDGLNAACSRLYDVILLDISLPELNGLNVLESIRRKNVESVVIMLTSRSELEDRVTALDNGADDYLSKPFYMNELISRMNAQIRRSKKKYLENIELGNFSLSFVERKLYFNNESIKLTNKEFYLLKLMMSSPNEIFTRGQLLQRIWGYDFDPCTNVVDVCIKRTRKKIISIVHEGNALLIIESIRGMGYKLNMI